MNKLFKSILMLVLSLGLAFSFGLDAFADTPNVDFIDVSHYNSQSGLPLAFYQTIKASGVKGVVVKVSEGTGLADPAASVNIANAKQAGLIVNAYHFARYTSDSDAVAEAKWFDKQLQIDGFDKQKDGYVVVDIEATNLSSDKSKLTEYTNTFLNEMKSLGYSKVDIYSGSYFYNTRLKPNDLSVDKPWLAAYPSKPQKGQPTANFSNGKGAWQWTSSYVFNGMSNYGRFDVSEDYSGKYSGVISSATVGTIGPVSLVNYLKSHGMSFYFDDRAKLAKSYGITNYSGTAAQNLALLSKLESGVKPAKVSAAKPKAASKTTILKKGDKGTQVKTLQKSLNSKGFSVGIVDGIFGAKTESGIKSLQRATHITVDGIYGPQTSKALNNYVALPGGIIQKGDHGSNVKKLQQALNKAGFNCGKADGIFGSKTQAAVKKLQKQAHIKKDGIYGPNTKKALQKEM